MNILHISPYLPSLKTNHAGGVCMGKQIESLKKRHKVHILTFLASDFDRKLFRELKGDPKYHTVVLYPWVKVLHILSQPWLPSYFSARTSLRFSIKLLWCVWRYQIEAIHGEYASMGQYLWIKKIFPHLRYYMIEHDVTTQSYERRLEFASGWKQWYLQYQLKRLLYFENRYCHFADSVLTFSYKDKTLLEKQYNIHDVRVLNPFFGIEDFDIKKGEKKRNEREPYTICFMGQMGREENISAALRLIHIVESIGDQRIQLYIAGNQPSDELLKKEAENIHVTGFVENVDQYILKAKVAVFPLEIGAGIKLKVLRSLALGTPVITTAIGAEGIDEEGQYVFLAEKDKEFIYQIHKILAMEDEQYSQLSIKCRAFVSGKFGWKASEAVLDELYAE